MKIPSQFQLAGIVWTVEFVDGLDMLGLTERDKAKIKLRKGLPRQIAEATFCHELQHAFLFTMGVPEGDHDEKEIEKYAYLLHQYLNNKGA